MRIADYIGIITGIFTGCMIFDLINGYFHKPFFRFGIYLAKIVNNILIFKGLRTAKMKNEEYKDCQLCKHLDCDTEGYFICGLDGDILDHEGIYCNRFEKYIEGSENVENK